MPVGDRRSKPAAPSRLSYDPWDRFFTAHRHARDGPRTPLAVKTAGRLGAPVSDRHAARRAAGGGSLFARAGRRRGHVPSGPLGSEGGNDPAGRRYDVARRGAPRVPVGDRRSKPAAPSRLSYDPWDRFFTAHRHDRDGPRTPPVVKTAGRLGAPVSDRHAARRAAGGGSLFARAGRRRGHVPSGPLGSEGGNDPAGRRYDVARRGAPRVPVGDRRSKPAAPSRLSYDPWDRFFTAHRHDRDGPRTPLAVKTAGRLGAPVSDRHAARRAAGGGSLFARAGRRRGHVPSGPLGSEGGNDPAGRRYDVARRGAPRVPVGDRRSKPARQPATCLVPLVA